MEINVDKERLKKFEAATLLLGGHKIEAEGTGCVMNWANFLAGGEGNTDSHPCVSRPIRRLLIALNDRLNDEDRQKLKPYALSVLGTSGSSKVEQKRAWMAADCAIRELAPIWLEAAGLTERAAQLRGLPEITKSNRREAKQLADEAWGEARELWRNKKERILDDAAAAAAADDAAAAAAAAAAADAAAAAAADADAADAAADAADAAADAAAAAAAAAAARWNQVYEQTYKETKARILEKLRPTRIKALSVVLALIDRMIAVK